MKVDANYDEHLVDLIYATAFGDATWQQFLETLNKSLPEGRSALFFHDASVGSGSFEITQNIPPEWSRDYARHYAKLNPWMIAAAIRPIGVGVVAEQMLPRDRFINTEFYNDFFRSFGNESAVGATIIRRDGRSFLLSILTASFDAEENRRAAERLTFIAPHLRRVFRHLRGESDIDVDGHVRNQLFGALGIALVAVGENGTIRAVSDLAMGRIARGAGIATNVHGRLSILTAEAQEMLHLMLTSSRPQSRVKTFIVGDDKITLIKVQKSRHSEFFEGPTVVVLLEEHRRQMKLQEERLKATFGLSKAELQTFRGILSGRSVAALAQEAERSRETIRSHLKSIYAKTGQSKQTDLFRLAAQFSE